MGKVKVKAQSVVSKGINLGSQGSKPAALDLELR